MVDNTTSNLFETEDEGSQKAGHIIRVAFDSGADTEFDYIVPDILWPMEPGQRVEVPFGWRNKIQSGFCVQIDVPKNESGKYRLKKVRNVLDKKPLIDSNLMELAAWISQYYVCPLGQVLAAMVPAAVKKGAGQQVKKYIYLVFDPNEKEKIFKKIRGSKQKELVKLLDEKGAWDAANSIALNEAIETVGCSRDPLKSLVRKKFLKIAQHTVLKSPPVIPGNFQRPETVILNSDQEDSLAHIISEIDSNRFGVTLLHGVTDSGKTEVYIRAVDFCLRKNKTAIVLLPEIALTTQIIQRFSSRFKKLAVMHSGLTGPQRNQQWQKIKAGEADVVIGVRSAIFAPLSNIGLIVVDEEHETSYKQDTAPRYNAKDLAIKRAQLSLAHCLLGSATPSLETFSNCDKKEHFNIVRMTKRVMNLAMPEMKLVDMTQRVTSHKDINLISQPLAEHLEEALARDEQAILLLNKRGYSSFILCPYCKHTLSCKNCDVSLTFHKSNPHKTKQHTNDNYLSSGQAMCHYCGAKTLVPKDCPVCSKDMIMVGLGCQGLVEEINKRFPDARIARVDSDSMQTQDYYRVLESFSDKRIDILAGTQMIAKGLHFPNVTLVGIISADTSLNLPDFRSNERTFQMISQVAGRAGRSLKKGTVYVQTFLPNQPAIQYAINHDYNGFVEYELNHRKECKLPPFWRMAAVVLRDENFEKLEKASELMRKRMDNIINQDNLGIIVRGPVPSVISRIQGHHRMHITAQGKDASAIQQLFTKLRSTGPLKPNVKFAVDIDPVNLL